MEAIVLDGVSKVHTPSWPWQKPVQGLDNVSFTVNRGEIFGFLGPNGAGKTTTMKILLGLMKASRGSIRLLGMPGDDVMVHHRIGYLPESPYFYDYLTAEEFLSFYGRLGGMDKGRLAGAVPSLLERVGLLDAQHRQLRKFSKGMLQRIGLAQALIHDPELVILDEPMSGLDPVGRKEVRDIILSLRDRGKTVFFSTHIISDVEMVCDRVCILSKGKVLALGKVEELVNEQAQQSVEIVSDGIIGEDIPLIRRVATRILQRGDRCLIMLPRLEQLDEVLTAIRQAGGRLLSAVPHKGNLETLFIERTNQGC
ncbi:ABC-type transport system, ATPase component [Nitrospira japonica]|uniref:ABC-type transport system, ATPase component n=1 Tax=Nitrospira japonica TaxID=1325564 RepID=A0A1W1I0M2_9BACT|nr:ABC transporter ATP-binding protein [Nitrospira japonica]SLM46429.1 ABC-type transport system, ATPase component [Nitrospira japonica]